MTKFSYVASVLALAGAAACASATWVVSARGSGAPQPAPQPPRLAIPADWINPPDGKLRGGADVEIHMLGGMDQFGKLVTPVDHGSIDLYLMRQLRMIEGPVFRPFVKIFPCRNCGIPDEAAKTPLAEFYGAAVAIPYDTTIHNDSIPFTLPMPPGKYRVSAGLQRPHPDKPGEWEYVAVDTEDIQVR